MAWSISGQGSAPILQLPATQTTSRWLPRDNLRLPLPGVSARIDVEDAIGKELEHAWARAAAHFQQLKELEATAPAFVEHLGPALRCGWAAIWKTRSEGDTLKVVSTWHSKSVQSSDLEDFTLHWQPGLGEGMVGKAWRTLQPQYSENVVQDMVLPRSLYARGAGLVGGLWLPTRTDKVGFVLELLWNSSPQKGVIELLGKLPGEIAAFIERASRRP